MNGDPLPYSLDHAGLLDTLARTDKLLIIQDLDGVCMGLVRDPLTRRLERRYIDAARRLDGRFYVLTNGEHIGRRGVNAIVDRALHDPRQAREQGAYLPGLAAGGVQWQDRYGTVSHPGVSEAELQFLAAVPARAREFLRSRLRETPYGMPADEIDRLADAAVLDNPASPTLNINVFHAALDSRRYAQWQLDTADFMRTLLQQAAAQGLSDSFFVHYAPNLGRDAGGEERLKPAEGDGAGTTDFQFMLKGAIKEVGVLVLLNRYYRQQTGRYPLGADFNARQAPREHEALLALARDHFDPALMPRIVGIGDTVTSQRQPGHEDALRGGSDRGFLTLVQALGEVFGTDNTVVFIDSHCEQVRRPRVDVARLQGFHDDPSLGAWPALEGITDAQDPLRLDVIFPGGHAQYVDFFCALAERRA